MRYRKNILLLIGLCYGPLLCLAQSKNEYLWKLHVSGGYSFAEMAGSAAKRTTSLNIASFFAYSRSTYTDAGKRLQTGKYWSAGIVRRINELLDIGISIGETEQGGYARIDTLYSAYQFRDPIFKREGGYGKDRFQFRYLIFPVSLYFYPLKQRKFYFLFEGWYASLQAAIESVYFKSYSKHPQDNANYEIDEYNNYQHDNWGISAGAGFDISLIDHLHISSQIKYAKGFENVIVKSKNNTDSRAFIQSLDMGIGVIFLF